LNGKKSAAAGDPEGNGAGPETRGLGGPDSDLNNKVTEKG